MLKSVKCIQAVVRGHFIRNERNKRRIQLERMFGTKAVIKYPRSVHIKKYSKYFNNSFIWTLLFEYGKKQDEIDTMKSLIRLGISFNYGKDTLSNLTWEYVRDFSKSLSHRCHYDIECSIVKYAGINGLKQKGDVHCLYKLYDGRKYCYGERIIDKQIRDVARDCFKKKGYKTKLLQEHGIVWG